MKNLPVVTLMLAFALTAGACRNPDYKPPDPSIALCNQGGPLTARQLIIAREPKPQAIPGRPAGCEVGPDGIMRMVPASVP